MKKTQYSLRLFLSSQLFFAQQDKLTVFAGVDLQPTIYKYQPAAHINVRSYLNDRVSLGGALSFTSKNYNEGFGYAADRTRSNHIMLNVLAQNDFISSNKVVFGMNISTGLYIFRLMNPDEKTTEISYTEVDGVVTENEYEVHTKLSRDIFYNVQAGFDFSLKLAKITEESISIYLTTRAGYQHVIGKGDFLSENQFSKPVFSLGITIKGDK